MKNRNPRRFARSRILCVEALEQRTLLSAVSWSGNGDGVNWTDTKNWSGNKLPTATDDVFIDVAANPTINIAGTQMIRSLNDSENLRIGPGATLSLGQASSIRGDIANDGKFENLTNLVLDGMMAIGNTAGTTTGIVDLRYISQFITGAGAFVFGGSTGNVIHVESNVSATLSGGVRIRGNNGTVNADGNLTLQTELLADTAGGTLQVTGNYLNNNLGSLRAINGATLIVAPKDWYSDGNIIAENSTITLGGTWAGRNSGKIFLRGASTLNLGGIFKSADVNLDRDNPLHDRINITGSVYGSLDLTSWSGNVYLVGGSVGNVTQGKDAHLIPTPAGGRIYTMVGDLDVGVYDGATVSFTGYMTGKIFIGSADGSRHGRIEMTQSGFSADMIFGKCEIIFGGSPDNAIVNFGSDFYPVQFGEDVHIRGKNGSIINETTGRIHILGTLSADVAGGTIHLKGGSFANAGKIEAAPGTIVYEADAKQLQTGVLAVGIGGSVAGTSYGQFIFKSPSPGFFSWRFTVYTTYLMGNFLPTAGQTFTMAKYVSPPSDKPQLFFDAGNGVHFDPTFAATALTLKAVANGTNFASKNGSALTVTGTAGPDAINLYRVYGLLAVQRAGVYSIFNDSDIKTVKINALGGDDRVMAHDGRAETIDGGPGNDRVKLDYGIDSVTNAETQTAGTISGVVYNDSNLNGTRDPNEAGISGRVIFLDVNNNGQLDVGETTKTTDSTGAYSFTLLPDGLVSVCEALTGGFRITGSPPPSILVSGKTYPNADFGNTAHPRIFGSVFVGFVDNPFGLPAPAVVYLDQNLNGKLDATEKFQTTNQDFDFSDISPGTYHVRLQSLAGYRIPTPATGGYDISLAAGESTPRFIFIIANNPLLSGRVFNDANNNGKFDAGEVGTPDVTLLFTTGGQSIALAVTDDFGLWVVDYVSAGTGEVTIQAPAGYSIATPTGGKYSGTATSGQIIANLNFGLHAISPAPLFAAGGSSLLDGEFDRLDFFAE